MVTVVVVVVVVKYSIIYFCASRMRTRTQE